MKALRKVLLSVIGFGCSWTWVSSADAQVFFARGVEVVAVVHFDGEPKTAASVQMQLELQHLESANRLYAARQQYWSNQQAANQYINAQRQQQAQQFTRRNTRTPQRATVKKNAKKP